MKTGDRKMTRYGVVIVGVLAVMGCATGTQGRMNDVMSTSPTVHAKLLREDPADHVWRSWREEDALPTTTPLAVEVAVAEIAHVSVILYSPQGESEDLAGAAGLRMSAGASQRFLIPRRAPPGVKETELRVYVVASAVPLSGAARGLLRLRCSASTDGGRGNDREDESPKPVEKPP